MRRLLQFSVVAFVLVGVLIFAAALAGGLTDDSAFTPAAKAAAHAPPATEGDVVVH